MYAGVPFGSCASEKNITLDSINIQYLRDDPLRTVAVSGKRRKPRLLPYFPTYDTFTVLSPTPTVMSTDQRASERVGELIHHAFESLLQANTDLERLQDLIGLGMDLKQLLAPHSQTTWKFMVPQEQRFRENWNKFISALETAEASASRPQQAGVGTVEPAPTPLPAITPQAPEEAPPEAQSKVWSLP